MPTRQASQSTTFGECSMAKQTQSPQGQFFSPEQLQAYIDQAVAKVMEVKKIHEDQKRSDDMSAAVLKAFKRQGYRPEAIVPHETVLTYNKWIEQGRKVRQGETSVRVGSLRLFHKDQTEPMNAVEKKAALQALEEKKAKRTADKLPKVSPVAEPVKAKGKGKTAPAQPAA